MDDHNIIFKYHQGLRPFPGDVSKVTPLKTDGENTGQPSFPFLSFLTVYPLYPGIEPILLADAYN